MSPGALPNRSADCQALPNRPSLRRRGNRRHEQELRGPPAFSVARRSPSGVPSRAAPVIFFASWRLGARRRIHFPHSPRRLEPRACPKRRARKQAWRVTRRKSLFCVVMWIKYYASPELSSSMDCRIDPATAARCRTGSGAARTPISCPPMGCASLAGGWGCRPSVWQSLERAWRRASANILDSDPARTPSAAERSPSFQGARRRTVDIWPPRLSRLTDGGFPCTGIVYMRMLIVKGGAIPTENSTPRAHRPARPAIRRLAGGMTETSFHAPWYHSPAAQGSFRRGVRHAGIPPLKFTRRPGRKFRRVPQLARPPVPDAANGWCLYQCPEGIVDTMPLSASRGLVSGRAFRLRHELHSRPVVSSTRSPTAG
jgi:hypothetical protein